MEYLLCHLFGDFILQTDWIAINKKQSNIVCLIHVITYLLPFLLLDLYYWQYLLISIQHYSQDRTNFVIWFMKYKGSPKFIEPPMGPWSIIITDNILHLIWIYFVLNILPNIG